MNNTSLYDLRLVNNYLFLKLPSTWTEEEKLQFPVTFSKLMLVEHYYGSEAKQMIEGVKTYLKKKDILPIETMEVLFATNYPSLDRPASEEFFDWRPIYCQADSALSILIGETMEFEDVPKYKRSETGQAVMAGMMARGFIIVPISGRATVAA